MFAHVGAGKHVESSANSLQLADCMEPAEIGPWNAIRFEIPWAQNPRLFDQFQHFVCVCGSSRHIDANVTLHRDK